MAANARKETGEKLIATNPIARTNYFIEELLEAGVALTGTEVKSLRAQSPNLRDGFVEVSGRAGGGCLEAWLVNVHIGPYSHGNIWNHLSLRKRKLLLHRREIDRLHAALVREGCSVIPTRMYFKQGRAKVELGLGKGKKKHDKRQDLKKRSAEREMDVARKRSRE
jgi:SsrA-binding protein